MSAVREVRLARVVSSPILLWHEVIGQRQPQTTTIISDLEAVPLQVVVHVMGSFQVYSMPVFDMIESQMVKRGISNGLPCRLIYRSAYVVIVAFVGITLPFFGASFPPS